MRQKYIFFLQKNNRAAALKSSQFSKSFLKPPVKANSASTQLSEAP